MTGVIGFLLTWSLLTAADPPPADWASTRFVLRPAAEPVPALKYRLERPRRLLEPGNAALNYHRALGMLRETWLRQAPPPGADPKAAKPSASLEIAAWASGPLDAIPMDRAKPLLERYQMVLNEIRLGAMQDHCDWGLERRREGIALVLTEVQNARELARLLALKTRVSIREGNIDEAWDWIQTGMALGRHVGDGDTLIQTLVGVAISSVTIRCMEEFVQMPGSPNLYWALANRRHPQVDMQRALEGEMTLLVREVPELETLDDGVWSLDQAQRFSRTLNDKMSGLSQAPRGGTGAGLGLAMMAARLYPEAKAALIAGGRPAADVEAMPVIQVSALYAYREYLKERDDRSKWMGLPYSERAKRRPARAATPTPAEAFQNPLKAMFSLLEPALDAANQAGLRLERQLDALQAVEAIRLYMASHDGALPERLEAITVVPVPIDPAFGEPFGYERQGGDALLWSPVPTGSPSHPSFALKYLLVPAGK